MRLGVLLVMMLTAAATAMSASSASSSTQTIRLISTSPQVDGFTDTGKRGQSRGDTMVIRTSLFNERAQFGKREGARVGRSIEILKFTSDTTADAFGTLWLPPGTLGFEGHYKESGPVVYRAFGGGRGVWANARGTLTGKKLSGKDRGLHLRLSTP